MTTLGDKVRDIVNEALVYIDAEIDEREEELLNKISRLELKISELQKELAKLTN